MFGGDSGLYDRISALDNLSYFADVYRVPSDRKQRRIDELLEIVGLKGAERERVETYSRGMRQRLHIARGLLHDPEVSSSTSRRSGSIRSARASCGTTVSGLQASGKTILLTTHYMFEADELCERVAVINVARSSRKARRQSSSAALIDRSVIEIEAFGVHDGILDAFVHSTESTGSRSRQRDQAQLVAIQSQHGPELARPALLALLGTVTIGRVVAREPTLEDAYVELVSS